MASCSFTTPGPSSFTAAQLRISSPVRPLQIKGKVQVPRAPSPTIGCITQACDSLSGADRAPTTCSGRHSEALENQSKPEALSQTLLSLRSDIDKERRRANDAVGRFHDHRKALEALAGGKSLAPPAAVAKQPAEEVSDQQCENEALRLASELHGGLRSLMNQGLEFRTLAIQREWDLQAKLESSEAARLQAEVQVALLTERLSSATTSEGALSHLQAKLESSEAARLQAEAQVALLTQRLSATTTFEGALSHLQTKLESSEAARLQAETEVALFTQRLSAATATATTSPGASSHSRCCASNLELPDEVANINWQKEKAEFDSPSKESLIHAEEEVHLAVIRRLETQVRALELQVECLTCELMSTRSKGHKPSSPGAPAG